MFCVIVLIKIHDIAYSFTFAMWLPESTCHGTLSMPRTHSTWCMSLINESWFVPGRLKRICIRFSWSVINVSASIIYAARDRSYVYVITPKNLWLMTDADADTMNRRHMIGTEDQFTRFINADGDHFRMCADGSYQVYCIIAGRWRSRPALMPWSADDSVHSLLHSPQASLI